ncbi:hypothetical protein FRC06_010252 [Ceratobasidium sp. 370]|nr:hypothetical protein FRC06_010252 [Ceratobasidium sp. 370]
MSLTPGDIVKSQLANNSPDPDARPVTPEPMTPSGVQRGCALYDTPPEGEQPAKFRSGPRRRRSSSQYSWYTDDQARKANIWNKALDTRHYNARLRARIKEPPKDNSNNNSNSNGNDNANPEPLPKSHPRHCGKKRAVRELSQSPMPGLTDHKPNPPTQQQTGESQYTYVYETFDHDGLVKYTEERLRFDLRSKDTQTILPASIEFQSASPLQVGGGWHLESTPLGTGTSGPPCGAKRGSDVVDTSNESNKRPRLEPENDSATSSETEDEDEVTRLGPACVAAEHIIQSCSSALPLEAHPSLPGTRAPPPTRDVTPATVLASATPSRTQSFGASLSQPGQPMPPLLMILIPPRGKVMRRHSDKAGRDAEAAKAAKAAAPDPNKQVDELEATDTREVPETEPNDSIMSWHSLAWKPHSTPTAPAPRKTAPQRTYGGTRSHAPPVSKTNTAAPNPIEQDDSEPEDPEPIP